MGLIGGLLLRPVGVRLVDTAVSLESGVCSHARGRPARIASCWLAFGVGRVCLVVALLAGNGPIRSHPQGAAAPARVLDADLVDVRGAALLDSVTVVLTAPERAMPAMHIFPAAGRPTHWGRTGEGPGELQNPTQVQLRSDTVFVLDMRPGASVVHVLSLDGRLLSRIPLPRLGIVRRIFARANDLLVHAGQFGERGNQIVRVSRDGSIRDTLLRYDSPPKIRIAPSAGPTYSVSPPFAPLTRWAATADGGAVVWLNGDTRLAVLAPDGRRVGALALPPTPAVAIDAKDRESWFAREFPANFFGRRDDPLRLVRARAQETVAFPDTFPSVLELDGDADGGVWVKRAPASHGETWVLVRRGFQCRTVTFAAGREVLSFGRVYVAVRASDGSGKETVELYRRSALTSCAPS